MLGGMIHSTRGCLKEELRMDIISNNLANSAVYGFKRDTISFNDLLGESMSAGSQSNIASMNIEDTHFISVKTDLSQGDIRLTGNDLDLAIFGDGFFKINTAEGIRYTRKGNFTLDAQGMLITQDGSMVMGQDGPINILGSEVTIDNKGTITVDGEQAGKLDLVDFEDYSALKKQGNSIYENILDEKVSSIPAETEIKQGYLELSNVNVAEEMVKMIHCVRAFESYQKAIQIIDGMDSRTINEVGKLR